MAAVRLELPVWRARSARLPAGARDHEPGAVPGRPLLPAAPTYRLAYRNFKGLRIAGHHPVRGGRAQQAGQRWYEIRRDGAGDYSLFQQGTFAPADGVHRWMGSIAQNKKGGMALGYSVVNATMSSPASATPAGSPAIPPDR